MAKLRPFRGKWYARSRWVDNGNKIEKLTPLRTSSKVTARERIAEVNKVEFLSKPTVLQAMCNPAVQLVTATAYLHPTILHTFFSKILIFEPCVIFFDFKTFTTDLMSSSSI